MSDTTTPREPSPIAIAVHAAVKAEHADCSPLHCALNTMWVEDVQEILEAFARHVAPGVTPPRSDD